MTDRELLGSYARGSQEAFCELVDRHAGRVYGACLRVLGNAHAAEDATQAVFLVLARKAAGLARSGMLAGWLHTVARDTARNLLREETRRRRRENEAAMQAGSRANGTEPPAGAAGASGGQLDAALAALPAAQRQVLLLRHCHGRTEAEVAEELGWSRSRTSVTLSRAMAALRSGLVRRGVAVPAAAAIGGMLATEAGAGAAALPPALLAALKGIGSETAAGAIPAKVASLAEGTMKAMMIAKAKLAAAVVGAVLVAGGGGGFLATRLAAGAGERSAAAADLSRVERKGPLAGLPSEPNGEHLAKIRALGDNQWVDLGSPAPDPKWGRNRGRSWAPKAAYAPDLRGAFYCGEAGHGWVKPNGYYHDDLWFYDIGQHRWLCVYPGIKADGGYAEIKINKDGYESTPDGHALPIATMVHAYEGITYDTDRKLFMSMTCDGGYWKKAIVGRNSAFEEGRKPKAEGSPWIYNTIEGHWDRLPTQGQVPYHGFGNTLIYVPAVKKSFFVQQTQYPWQGRPHAYAWYDHETRDWSIFKPGGTMPPFHNSAVSCYDSKRNRIYMGGGGGLGKVEKREVHTLWAFDVAASTFTNPEPKGYPGWPWYPVENAMMSYDSVADAVVLFIHRIYNAPAGGAPGIYVYHPGQNEWETVAERPPALARKGNDTWTGFYDPELNVHFLHHANDGSDQGTMWAYRYKRSAEKP